MAVKVGVKVTVKVIVGVNVDVKVLVGVAVAITNTGISNISAVKDCNVSMKTVETNTGVDSRMPTRFLTGVVNDSSNTVVSTAALI